MALRNRRWMRGPDDEDEGGGGGETPAQVNARNNNRRLSRIEEIARAQDGRRSAELQDIEGERVVGDFAGGAFNDSPEAREAEALREDEEARMALAEEEERAREEEEREGEDTATRRRARRLQEEGAEDEDGEGESRARAGSEEEESEDNQGDEKVVDGVRYYRTIVGGQEKWLTLTQLREGAASAGNAAETLQRAQEALQRSSTAALDQTEDADEDLDEEDLRNIILSASMGDEEAVGKLASTLAKRPKGVNPQVIAQQVSQQVATRLEVERAERAQRDILKNPELAMIFRTRLSKFGKEKPDTKIVDAYRIVGEGMRKDYSGLLKNTGTPSKQERKRALVNPPHSAGRIQRREESNEEPSVHSEIDAIAKSRGQDRAHRQIRR